MSRRRDLLAEARPHTLSMAARCVFERIVPALPEDRRDEAILIGRLLEALAAGPPPAPDPGRGALADALRGGKGVDDPDLADRLLAMSRGRLGIDRHGLD